MRKFICHSFLLRWAFGAFLLAVCNLQGQTTVPYLPNLFDISISFGCDCTCNCETNTLHTNNPVSMFLAGNPVTAVASSTAVMPPVGQLVPPHWSEFTTTCFPPSYGGSVTTFPPEGWTSTTISISPWGYANNAPVTFNLNYPISFNYLDYLFYANLLSPTPPGLPGNQPIPSGASSNCQPYPWDVNLTLQLQNGQLYTMEQQLVVGYAPEVNSIHYETPVDYVETNSLLTITLYCTNNGVVTILPVSRFIITATLLPYNIPAPLSTTTPWSFTPDFYTNWAWPLTPTDTVEPSSPYNSPGAAGTVQASLDSWYFNNLTVDHTNLLVRADRAYIIELQYWLPNCPGGPSYSIYPPLYYTNTAPVPPCTNIDIPFYTTICSICITNPSPPVCWVTNVGLVDMMGTPDDPPGITMWAYGDNNYFSANLAGPALPGTPVPFQLPVFMVNETSDNFKKWATEALGLNTSYEYFSSPVLYPVAENCNQIADLTNDFVMCTTNPAIVKGTVTLCGPVDTNYYGGQAALDFLKFADYYSSGLSSGLPYDPAGIPTAGAYDPTLLHVSSIQATNGASTSSPFNNGDGLAVTEFDNPGTFNSNPNSYIGNYSLKLAGLKSLPSVWNVNDLHLVFGSPVSLDYHVYETNPAYTNVNITCGEIVTNNIALCFNLVTIQVTNVFPQPIPANLIYGTASLQISGTGPGYTVGPLTFNIAMLQSPTANYIDIPLFLPEGNYQCAASVLYASGYGGINNLFTTNFTITCACSTNVTMCCTNCAPPYPESYTVTVYPGFNFLANDLCQGINNNTVANLLPNVPNGTQLYTWNHASQDFNPVLTYSVGPGWDDPTVTLSAGEGFILYNLSTTNFTLTISGCEPDCPLPCTPTNGLSLIGAYGTSTATWSNLFSCPPVCGTEVFIYTPGATGGYTTYTYGIGGWIPFPPVLAIGQSAWVYVNPTPGLTVNCPRNKTVQCGTNWTFDLPTGTSCCASNVYVKLTGTVTNGGCPQLITRTWLLSDYCGEADTCSQTVTVINTNLPVLVCASNITVSSDQPWNFTWPTATVACCTNPTITIVGTVITVSTNPCAINYTRTWHVTDCCTNTAICSQTVTVFQTGLCQVFDTGMNGTSVLPTGATDPNFVLVSVPSTWAGTTALVINPSYANGAFVGLHDGPNSQWIGPDTTLADEPLGAYHYRLQFLLCCTNGAELSGRMAADSVAGVYLNTHFVASIPGYTTWTPISVTSGFVGAPLLNTLDIYVTNNYTTGYPGPTYPATAFRAEVTNCISQLLVSCATNKTVGCGSNWTFDLPNASSCCGSNVTTTVVSTVTNGVGHITFTGGGSAANGEVVFVGNTATSGFLDITAGTNMGTYTLSPGSGSNTLFVWDGLIFPTSNPFLDLDGLFFTNSGVEINLYGNGPGSYTLVGAPPAFEPLVTNGVATLAACSQMITRTWVFTDTCGNSNTCSQTVTVTIAPPVIVCSTNKTIPCTSNVVFDLPAVVSTCCGTNYSISTFGNDVTTNTGPDTQATTRTWLITDCCGNTNFCSQTVTVQNTTLYAWTTLAGLAGNIGSADGTGSAARFFTPDGVAVDSAGNVFVADQNNHTIRKVTPAGVVTTLAGLAGTSGTNDGTGSAARFNQPNGVAVDSAGVIYVADTQNHTIRKVTPVGTNWVVTTLAGLAGNTGNANGTGSAARFSQPTGVAVDSATPPNVYVADHDNSAIRKVTSVGGVVTTLAGLVLSGPAGVAVDSATNLYVADRNNSVIRKVTAAGVETTLAGLAGTPGTNDGTGSAARFNLPYSVAVDSAGNVFVADSSNHTIRKVTPAGDVTTLGGLALTPGSADGTGSAARFHLPLGVAVDSAGNVFVGDTVNYTIRKGGPTPCFTNPCPLVNTIGLNTGFDQTAGTIYTNGAADAFWWVTRDPTIPAATLPRPATVILGNPAWKPPQPNSQWISSYPTEQDNLNGEYDFETYFCLTTNASNVVVSVCLRADDAAGAYLNGHQITLSPADTTFKAASPACGTASMGLNPTWFVLGGQNVLQVRVTNIYAVAMGLNVAGSVTGTGLGVETASCCRPASGISGQKFHDLNGNGVRDLGEPARAGWTINLSSGATAVTDVNGYYYFQNLAAGTYTVTEVPQSGWTQTAPAGGSYTVTLGVSQQVNGRDFGNYRTNDTNCMHIFCPSNIVTECTGSGAVVPFTVTATSLCTTNPPIVTCTPPSTTLFPVGSTLVHCTAEDSLGDWATCSFTVTVQDTTPPVITCPSNIVIVTCSTNVPVGWSVTATDMCSSVTVTSSPPSGTIFHRDTTNIVTVVATDGSGNTNTCTFLVIVRKPTLNIAIGGSGFPVTVTITWLDGGTLLQADSVLGPWTDIPLATSPYTTAASASQKFYRLRCP